MKFRAVPIESLAPKVARKAKISLAIERQETPEDIPKIPGPKFCTYGRVQLGDIYRSGCQKIAYIGFTWSNGTEYVTCEEHSWWLHQVCQQVGYQIAWRVE